MLPHSHIIYKFGMGEWYRIRPTPDGRHRYQIRNSTHPLRSSPHLLGDERYLRPIVSSQPPGTPHYSYVGKVLHIYPVSGGFPRSSYNYIISKSVNFVHIKSNNFNTPSSFPFLLFKKYLFVKDFVIKWSS